MPSLPHRLFIQFRNREIKKSTLIQSLTILVEHSENDSDRLESLRYLREMGTHKKAVFTLLENLVLSDGNPEIRAMAARIMGDLFSEKVFIPLQWTLSHESDYGCLMAILSSIIKCDEGKVREAFVEILTRLKEQEYIDRRREYSNNSFRKSMKAYEKNWDINDIPLSSLFSIIVNYYTIQAIIERFYTVYFEWNDGLISMLDLSEIGWNVNLWKRDYAERLRDLSEVPGLSNLQGLKRLDLSNNKLCDIGALTELTGITELKLCNNRLADKKTILHLHQLPNLRYTDITGNPIAREIRVTEFPDINIVTYHGLNPRLSSFRTFYIHE